MVKKELVLKGLSIILDLLSAFILPSISEKIKCNSAKNQQREIIKEEIQSYFNETKAH